MTWQTRTTSRDCWACPTATMFICTNVGTRTCRAPSWTAGAEEPDFGCGARWTLGIGNESHRPTDLGRCPEVGLGLLR